MIAESSRIYDQKVGYLSRLGPTLRQGFGFQIVHWVDPGAREAPSLAVPPGCDTSSLGCPPGCLDELAPQQPWNGFHQSPLLHQYRPDRQIIEHNSRDGQAVAISLAVTALLIAAAGQCDVRPGGMIRRVVGPRLNHTQIPRNLAVKCSFVCSLLRVVPCLNDRRTPLHRVPCDARIKEPFGNTRTNNEQRIPSLQRPVTRCHAAMRRRGLQGGCSELSSPSRVYFPRICSGLEHRRSTTTDLEDHRLLAPHQTGD